jgi:hypothetical protein
MMMQGGRLIRALAAGGLLAGPLWLSRSVEVARAGDVNVTQGGSF